MVISLSIIAGTLAVLNPIQPRGPTYAAPSPNSQSASQTVSSSPSASTLEPRAYLPAVMQNFCTPIDIPADAKLFGVVFFDYNGDGHQQPNEPGIAGANISAGGASTLSQCNGVYYFRNLPDGSYSLTVTATGFRYLQFQRVISDRPGRLLW